MAKDHVHQKVSCCIPLGSVLGPILILISINDLSEVIQVSIKLFADDAKIYYIVTSQEDIEPFLENISFAVKFV